MEMEIGHVHHVYQIARALVIRNEHNLHVCVGDSVRIDGLPGLFPIKSLEVNDVDRAEVFPEDDLFGLVATYLPLHRSLRRKKVFLIVVTKKELAGYVSHIYPNLGVFSAKMLCCLAPGQIISVEGIEGFHTVESLGINHIRHDKFKPDDDIVIKAGAIPTSLLRYGARISLHSNVRVNTQKIGLPENTDGPQSEHDIWQDGAVKLSSDGLTTHPGV